MLFLCVCSYCVVCGVSSLISCFFFVFFAAAVLFLYTGVSDVTPYYNLHQQIARAAATASPDAKKSDFVDEEWHSKPPLQPLTPGQTVASLSGISATPVGRRSRFNSSDLVSATASPLAMHNSNGPFSSYFGGNDASQQEKQQEKHDVFTPCVPSPTLKWNTMMQVYNSTLTVEFPLNERGKLYSARLNTFIRARLEALNYSASQPDDDAFTASPSLPLLPDDSSLPLSVFTSTHCRSVQTAMPLAVDAADCEEWSALNAQSLGVVHSLKIGKFHPFVRLCVYVSTVMACGALILFRTHSTVC